MLAALTLLCAIGGIAACGSGSADDHRSGHVILAVSPARDCTRQQLAADYRGGGAGAGMDFGGIVFRDISDTSCVLAGTVSITGLDATGAPDTRTVAARFAGPGVLSPHAARVPAGSSPPPGELAYFWLLAAEYRDGATPNGLCAQQVRPAAWRVTLANGPTFTVPNVAYGETGSWDPSGGLITCQGNVGSEGAPSYWTS